MPAIAFLTCRLSSLLLHVPTGCCAGAASMSWLWGRWGPQPSAPPRCHRDKQAHTSVTVVSWPLLCPSEPWGSSASWCTASLTAADGVEVLHAGRVPHLWGVRVAGSEVAVAPSLCFLPQPHLLSTGHPAPLLFVCSFRGLASSWVCQYWNWCLYSMLLSGDPQEERGCPLGVLSRIGV